MRLPGPWLVRRAIDAAMSMAKEHGSGTITIRRSHHIACLAAYLKQATDEGMVIQLVCSDPNSASVAPFGGPRAVFTPNPLAIALTVTLAENGNHLRRVVLLPAEAR